MDREQEEMQFLGLWGIYNEAYKVIISWRKIFSQITLALILPLTFMFLAHIQISDILFSKIIHNEIELDETRAGTRRYDKISDVLTSEWTMFFLFKAAYFTFFLIFSLLSTSAVVYTIACIYTAREVTFKKVMSVVPKVWRRLMVTFLCVFIAFFAYHVISVATLIVLFVLGVGYTNTGHIFLYFLFIVYLAGFAYMGILWQLANVVSVLEDVYGAKAMIRSRALQKGKMLVATIIFLTLNCSLLAIQFLFGKLVVHAESLGMANRVCYGILCFLLLFVLFLFQLVIHTVIYFVCKSYHHENIDKSILSGHLEGYLGEYVPLTTKDVQLEHFEV